MTRRQFFWVLTLFMCCLLTNRVTAWLVWADARQDFHEAVSFHRYRPAFEAFLADHPLEDGEQVNGDRLPVDLAALGIINVYRNGRFVYFVVRTDMFIGERSTREFIRQVEHDERAIETILSTTKVTTYHIRRLNSAPGWYFW